MRKIILSNTIQIDLSNKSISENSENSIFSDTFFSKKTYPFELIITDEIDLAFGIITSYNTKKKIYIDCIYVHNNIMNKAILEFIEIVGEKASVVVSYGFDEYPSFDKKLSELSLDNFEVNDIYSHANSIITQSWPSVNYNFPMIHTNKYDDDDRISNFEGIINKRVDGIFVQNYSVLNNSVIPTDYQAFDKNIMQPLPYALHILKRGFIDGGFDIGGEILNDEILKKTTIFSPRDYFNLNNLQPIDNIYHRVMDYQTQTPTSNNKFLLKYIKNIVLPKAGLYKITGFGYSYDDNLANGIAPAETPLFRHNNANNNSGFLYIETYPIDTTIDTENTLISYFENYIYVDANNLNLYYQFFYLRENNFINDERVASEFKIELILEENNGNFSGNIINENKIDLTKSVPDMTFGEFVTEIKNYLNYDITGIVGNTIYLNKVISYFNYQNVKDLSAYEIKRVPRKFEEGNSFLLEFEDVDSTDYHYDKVFQDKNGTFTQGFSINNEKTKTITIKALPLPILNKSGIRTAFSFENKDNKPYFVAYTGLTNNINISLTYELYLLTNIHPIYWEKWFDFRLSAQIFRWQFFKDDIEIQDILIKDIIHAYQNIHLIKTIDKTEIKPGIFSFEIETYA